MTIKLGGGLETEIVVASPEHRSHKVSGLYKLIYAWPMRKESGRTHGRGGSLYSLLGVGYNDAPNNISYHIE